MAGKAMMVVIKLQICIGLEDYIKNQTLSGIDLIIWLKPPGQTKTS